MKNVALDVEGLPDFAIGHRDVIWWAVVGVMAIEGTVFALMIATYFYLRQNYLNWPPVGIPPQERLVATIGTVILVASAIAMAFVNQGAKEGSIRKMRSMLIVSTLLGIVFLVFRALEYRMTPVRWDSDAYGSTFWGTLFLHTVHGVTGTAENILFIVLLFKGPVERKHLGDIHANGIYWYFVAASWVVLYAMLYLDPGLFAVGR